jgi:hypothetical protein
LKLLTPRAYLRPCLGFAGQNLRKRADEKETCEKAIYEEETYEKETCEKETWSERIRNPVTSRNLTGRTSRARSGLQNAR